MAFLKDAIEALDPAPNKKSELTLSLNLISEMAENKVKDFDNYISEEIRTAGNGENRTIPVTEILSRHSEYRAYVKDDGAKVASEVSAAIKKFVGGGATNIIDGMSDLVTTGINAILGGGQAAQQEMVSYYIVVRSYGMARYDICAWSRSIEAEGITSKIEKAMAIYATKSSVDVTKISFNTFLLTYAQQLENMGIPEKNAEEYIDAAEKLYYRLKGAGSNSPVGLENVSSTGAGLLRAPGVIYFSR